MSQGFHLFQLQKIDAQLDQGVARALEIKNKIEADTRILDQQRLVDEAEKELATEHSHLKRIEQDTAARRIKLEQSESSLYGGKVRAPKELQDLQNEAPSKSINPQATRKRMQPMAALRSYFEQGPTHSTNISRKTPASIAASGVFAPA